MSGTTETRKLQMHERLLFDVIKRQAGTLEKAMLEGAMNAADAGSTECVFTLTGTKLVIVDDGKGFGSKAEIEKFFETFGQPPEEGEAKTYGYFRMGRGQLFSFGKNVWTSGSHRMEVDIKSRGLSYDLTTLSGTGHKGCKIEIELYDELSESQKLTVTRAFPRYVKYMPIAIMLNGERISNDLLKEKWDAETSDAYIKLSRSSQLHVYNQGAWVCDIYEHKYGTGGLIVSKKPLKVNFARNDIMNDCPVWKRIRSIVDQNAKKKNIRKKILTDGEMDRVAEQILLGEIDSEEGKNIRIFTDVAGRNWSAKKLSEVLNREFCYTVTSAPRYDHRGDKVHQAKLAFVLCDETLERFEARTTKAVIDIVLELANRSWMKQDIKAVRLDEVAKKCSERVNIVDNTKWKPTEKVWVDVLKGNSCWYLMGEEDRRMREIMIGDSDGKYRAWTDGCTFIAFDRKFLSGLRFGLEGLCRLYLTMLHEYCHDGPDSATHAHSQEFYQQFHDLSDNAVDLAVKSWTYLPKAMDKQGLKLTSAMAKTMDRIKATEKATTSFEAIAARDCELKDKSVPKAPKAKETIQKPKAEKGLYRGAYGVIFEAASGFEHREIIIRRAAEKLGKAEKLVKISYEVLRNPNHQSNGGRSKEEVRADGKVRLVVA